METIVIESHENDVEWGISFNGSNPEPESYFKMPDRETAFRLSSFLNGKTKEKWPDSARFHMIEKSKFYPGSEQVYQYGFYDGYQFNQ